MKENIIMLYPHVCFHYSHFKKRWCYPRGLLCTICKLGILCSEVLVDNGVNKSVYKNEWGTLETAD